MEDEIREFLETRRSSRAERPCIRYRKGVFELVVPEDMKLDEQKFLSRNFNWIRDRLPEAREYRRKVPDWDLSEGGRISVLGTERKISIEKRRTGRVSEEEILLAEHLVDRNSVRERLEETLRKHAREKFHEKVERFSGGIDGEYGRIFVRDQDTRWGSCSGEDNLNFNWRLVLCPEKVLEYVVVHEFVHLEVPDHSDRFWSRVEELMPDYREQKKWLSENSARLVYDRLRETQ
ncbi:MAG: M48 family metallopeptidase [Candidatus Nanosalina sp.]